MILMLPRTEKRKSLKDTLVAEQTRAAKHTKLLDPRATLSCHLYYDGPTIAPVEMYLRWGSDHVTVASLYATGKRERFKEFTPEYGKGRMRFLLPALLALGVDVKFENVLNARLRNYLLRHGFVADDSQGQPVLSGMDVDRDWQLIRRFSK